MSKSLFGAMLLTPEKATRVFLKLPNGDQLKDKAGAPSYIDVMSTDSVKANAARNIARDRRLAGDKVSAAQIDEESDALLAELTTGWYLVGFNGEPIKGEDGANLPFSVENAKVLYGEAAAAHWTEQVKSAAGMRQNFMPAPASA